MNTAVNDNSSFAALTLGLGGETFALDANTVHEILDLIPVTEVPGARDFVPGLINVRGRVVPLADLRVKFGMELKAPTVDSRIVVIEITLDGAPVIVGLLADKVFEVTGIGAASIEEAPEVGMQWRPDFIKGIGKRANDFVIIPNIETIFAAQ